MKGEKSAGKSLSIDVGLAVISCITPPGVKWTLRDIADVCGCHYNNIIAIEKRALQKLRNRFVFMHDPRLRDLAEEYFSRRQAAAPMEMQGKEEA